MKALSARTRFIKKAQKEKSILKEVSALFFHATLEDTHLRDIAISRIELSADGGLCFVYFYTPDASLDAEKFERLKLYGTSLRTALAQRLNKRYTPEIIFKIDTYTPKHNKLEELLSDISAKE